MYIIKARYNDLPSLANMHLLMAEDIGTEVPFTDAGNLISTLHTHVISDECCYFVAYDDTDRMVGMVGTMVTAWLGMHCGSVYSLYVLPECRNGRLALRLIDHAKSWLREKGIDHVIIQVQEGNWRQEWERRKFLKVASVYLTNIGEEGDNAVQERSAEEVFPHKDSP